jgi:TolB protein
MKLQRSILAAAAALATTIAATGVANATSPVASKIAFESDADGPVSLYAMRSDGSGMAGLGAPADAADAAWSPNGQRVAFEAVPPGEHEPEIFVMNADGTGVTQLTNTPGRNAWPDWFPNGKQIAFTSEREGPPEIWLMNADGSDQHPLIANFDNGRLEPSVSPNGRQVIYYGSSAPDVPPTIWVANSDGTNEHQLTQQGDYQDAEPTWSNSGRLIAFSSTRLGSSEIFVMNADGSNQHPVMARPGFDHAPAFSPDDSQIAWAKFRFGAENIWVMNTDGSGAPTQITFGVSYTSYPDWAPGKL